MLQFLPLESCINMGVVESNINTDLSVSNETIASELADLQQVLEVRC